MKLKETVGKKNEKEILLQEKSLLLEEKVKNISELDIKIGRHFVKFPPYNVFREILYCDIYVHILHGCMVTRTFSFVLQRI